MFLLLDELEISTADPQVNLMGNLIGNLYKSQWIEFPSSPIDFPTGTLDSKNFKGKEVAEIAKRNNFFEVKETIGKRKYEVVVNIDKLKKYLTEVAEFQKSTIEGKDFEALDEIFKNLNYTLQVEINNDYEISWIKGNFNIVAPVSPITSDLSSKEQTLNLDIEATLRKNKTKGKIDLSVSGDAPGRLILEFDADHKKTTVDISEPEGAQTFDLGSLLGGGLPGGGIPSGIPEGLGGLEGLDLEGLELPEGLSLEDLNLPQ